MCVDLFGLKCALKLLDFCLSLKCRLAVGTNRSGLSVLVCEIERMWLLDLPVTTLNSRVLGRLALLQVGHTWQCTNRQRLQVLRRKGCTYASYLLSVVRIGLPTLTVLCRS